MEKKKKRTGSREILHDDSDPTSSNNHHHNNRATHAELERSPGSWPAWHQAGRPLWKGFITDISLTGLAYRDKEGDEPRETSGNTKSPMAIRRTRETCRSRRDLTIEHGVILVLLLLSWRARGFRGSDTPAFLATSQQLRAGISTRWCHWPRAFDCLAQNTPHKSWPLRGYGPPTFPLKPPLSLC